MKNEKLQMTIETQSSNDKTFWILNIYYSFVDLSFVICYLLEAADNGDFGLDRRMRIIADDLNVLKSKIINFFNLWIKF